MNEPNKLEFEYDGPAEFADQWYLFAADYISEGSMEAGLEGLNLLNELVFKLPASIDPQASHQERAEQTAVAVKEFIAAHSDMKLNSLRNKIQDAASATISDDLADPLNREIQDRLIGIWLSLEDAQGLPTLPMHSGLKKTEEWKRHEELFKSPEGSLIGGSVFAASDGTIRAQSNILYQKFKGHGINYDQIYSLAFDELKSAVYRYEPGQGQGDGASFNTYLIMRLSKKFPRVIRQLIENNISLDAEIGNSGDGSRRGDLLTDERAKDPFLAAASSDYRERIEEALRRVGGRDAEVIRLRFGLGDDPWTRTLEEVGGIMGVTGERIRQIEKGALEKLRKYLEAPNVDLEPATVPEESPFLSDKQPVIPPAKPKEKEVLPELPRGKKHAPLIPLDMARGKELAEKHAGSKVDLAAEGISENLANRLDALLAKKNTDGKVVFGRDNEPLRVSQEETLEKFSKALHESTTSGYAVIPGGVGKTRIGIVSAAAAKDAGLKTLYIVPSLMAANSVCDKLRKTRPDVSVGRVYDGHQEFDKDVTVVVYNSLYQHFYKSLIAQDEGKEYPFDILNYRMVIADEAHEYLTELSDHIFNNTDAVKLALTATDKYFEGKEVKDKFGHLINKVDLDQAYLRGEILKPKYRVIETSVDLNLDEVVNLDAKDELYSSEVEEKINTPQWNQVFVDVWKGDTDPETGHAIAGDKTFIHCASVQHAIDMADQFNEQLKPLLKTDEQFRETLRSKGIAPDKVKQIASPMSHLLSPKKRKELMEAYDKREILALTSSKMLIASVDDPETGIIMNAVPTFSRVRAGQRGYRGSRMAEGKNGWYIYEALPHDWENGKYAPVLFAEAAEDPQIEGLRNKGRAAGTSAKERKEESNGHNIKWQLTDVADILDKLYLIRLKRRGLEALDANWLEDYDNQRGRFLSALRKRAGLSRRDVGDALGLCDVTIWNYERGLGFQDIKKGGGSELGVAGFIEKLRPLYNTTPEEEQRLLHYFLPALNPEKFAQIPEEERPAALLKAYRLRAGVEQKTVANALGRDETFQANLSSWERKGRNSFNRAFLDDMSVSELIETLKPLYRMSDEEAQHLLVTLLPALNPKWLDKQPENRQVGLYLNALRRKGSCYSYEQMIENLGMEFNWEKRGGIDPSKLPMKFGELLDKLQHFYKLSEQEVERLTHLVLPALDPEKFEKIPEENKLAELLTAYRKRVSLRQDTAGEKIGEIFDAGKPADEKRGAIKFGTLSGWETRVAPPISQNSGMKEYIGAVIKAYELSAEEGKQLFELAIPALSPSWLDKQPADTRAGFMLMGYRQLLGQHRSTLAEHLGIDITTLGRYETGERQIPKEVFDAAAQHIGTHASEFFDRDEFSKRYESSIQAAGEVAKAREAEKQIRADFIKGLRENVGLTVDEAASQIGVSSGALSNYERGNGFTVVRHEQGSRMGVAKFIEAAREVYQMDQAQCTQLLHYLLPALDPKQQEAIPLEDRLPELLKAYRLRAGLELGEVAAEADISPTFASTLGNWEKGKSRPDRVPPSDLSVSQFVESIKKPYDLTDKESEGLLEAFFPALNKDWLYYQPEDKQLGELLKAYRLRGTTLTRAEAEEQLRFSLKVEKAGGNRIAPSRLGIPLDDIVEHITNLYSLSGKESASLKDRLAQTKAPMEGTASDRSDDWKALKAKRETLGLSLEAAAEKIGLDKWSSLSNWERRPPPIERNSGVKEHVLDIMKAYDIPDSERDAWIGMILPPLSSEWLDKQPERNRFGLLLMAYRQHTGLTRKELAEELDISNQVLGKYENGDRVVPTDFVDTMAAHYKAECPALFDEESFRENSKVSNTAIASNVRHGSGSRYTTKKGASIEKVGNATAARLATDVMEELEDKSQDRKRGTK